MSRWAIINLDGIIVNIIEWEGPHKEWLPPRNHHVIEINDEPYGCGDLYSFNDKTFSIHPDRLGKPDYLKK